MQRMEFVASHVAGRAQEPEPEVKMSGHSQLPIVTPAGGLATNAFHSVAVLIGINSELFDAWLFATFLQVPAKFVGLIFLFPPKSTQSRSASIVPQAARAKDDDKIRESPTRRPAKTERIR